MRLIAVITLHFAHVMSPSQDPIHLEQGSRTVVNLTVISQLLSHLKSSQFARLSWSPSHNSSRSCYDTAYNGDQCRRECKVSNVNVHELRSLWESTQNSDWWFQSVQQNLELNLLSLTQHRAAQSATERWLDRSATGLRDRQVDKYLLIKTDPNR